MKLYHFALFFLVIALSFFLTAQIGLLTKMHAESVKKTEYDCLVAAVNATVAVVFDGAENNVTEAGLLQAEEVFFQTLAVLHEGSTDRATWKNWRRCIPCVVVFGEKGYYQYGRISAFGYGWSELKLYENGQIPENFYEETEQLLLQYHNLQYQDEKKYRMKEAGKGVWEQSIIPPCVFAVYAPKTISGAEDAVGFLYAASGRKIEAYFVTEDNCCHVASCEKCKKEKIVARYNSQRESAEAGAVPCEDCLK